MGLPVTPGRCLSYKETRFPDIFWKRKGSYDMGMDEKNLKKLAEEQSAQIEIPDSLKPDQIEHLLESRGKKKKKAYYQKAAALAACGMLVIGLAAAGAGGMFGNRESGIDITSGGLSMADRADAEMTESAAQDSMDGFTEDRAESTGSGSQKDSGSGASGSSGQKTKGREEKTGASGAEFEVTSIRTAKNYDEIYEYISEQQKTYESAAENYAVREDRDSGGAAEGAADTAKSMEMEAVADEAAAPESGAGYSDTNVREEGVGEPDIVKTDGKRIYIVNNQRVQIVDIAKEEMKQLGTVKLSGESYISEIFIKDDRLVVVYTQTEFSDKDGAYGGYREYTIAETFDVSRPEKPKSIGKVAQSGTYNNMRVAGGYVYLFSNFYADTYCARAERDAYIPSVQGKRIDSGDILMPAASMGNKYTIVTAFSMKDPEKKIDSKAIFGSAGMCYVSRNNIYVCESNYGFYDVMPLARNSGSGEQDSGSSVTQTCIRKVSYRDGKLEAVGQTVVDGTLNDSFSIDEYEGNLRLAVTVSRLFSGDSGLMLPGVRAEEEEQQQDTNSLYILDENLEEISRIEGLAPDETIYSARFMGDTGYFVTFRQIDPLFSVDLSNPKKPEVIGELKIPGFSEYLHPYGEGLLLGIGMDVDETGTTTDGVKLSMFDISDPSDVSEVQKYILENTYSTDVSSNYKAALVDPGKNLIGFTAYGDTTQYYIFSYEEDGFECLFERELAGSAWDVRGLYSGSRLYLIAGNTVESYDIKTFEKIDDIVL